MAFPVSPTDGQTYNNNGVNYVYSSGLGVWNITGTASIGSPVTSVAGRQGAVTLAAADISGGVYAAGDHTVTGVLTVTSGNLVAASGTASTSTTTGALVVVGGAGISGAAYIGGATTITGAATLNGGVVTSTITASSATISGTVTAATVTMSAGIQNTPIGNATSSTGSFSSLGVGTAASGTGGELRCTNAITAFYSDQRLKTEVQKIDNALDKIDQLVGVIYTQNKLAETFGYNNYERQVGLYTQHVELVQPEAVKPAPFDIAEDGSSKSGQNYKTLVYERLVPLLVEGIKELRREINELKGK